MVLLIILLALMAAAGAVAYQLGREMQATQSQKQALEKQVEELSGQVAALNERLNGRHLSNRAVAGLEDAASYVTNLDFMRNELQARLDNMNADIDSLYRILTALRNAPEKYDPNRAAGRDLR